ncbi:glutathione S-transferase family protein [Rhizobium sp. SL86]|uniref:glutathione S-transferase family protein n=1 Tax=Rhizobium sp. SL86 TaxID=2995148 RepID=UPI002273A5C4|nr:glutathione S-transferase family protein [Rhizobium sp. SL86]MCY1666532.1 glutathione S-transferase family protein [Rhizobium sp. SL86]
MITLYGSLHSRANRCAWMLRELDLDFRHEPTNFQDGSTRKAEFLRLNPNGRVPVLDDDGFVLFESLAINLYLAKKFGGPLGPTDLQEEALMMQWSLWVENEVEKPLLLAAANATLFAPDKRSAEERDVALAKLNRPWTVLDNLLAEQPYLTGDRFTVADLNVASVMTLGPIARIDLTAFANLDAWLMRCLDRPKATDWRSVSFSIPRPPGPLGMLSMFV